MLRALIDRILSHYGIVPIGQRERATIAKALIDRGMDHETAFLFASDGELEVTRMIQWNRNRTIH